MFARFYSTYIKLVNEILQQCIVDSKDLGCLCLAKKPARGATLHVRTSVTQHLLAGEESWM